MSNQDKARSRVFTFSVRITTEPAEDNTDFDLSEFGEYLDSAIIVDIDTEEYGNDYRVTAIDFLMDTLVMETSLEKRLATPDLNIGDRERMIVEKSLSYFLSNIDDANEALDFDNGDKTQFLKSKFVIS